MPYYFKYNILHFNYIEKEIIMQFLDEDMYKAVKNITLPLNYKKVVINA